MTSEVCTAARHRPTLWFYRRYRCRCPETMQVVRAHWARYANRPRPGTRRYNCAPPPSPVAIGLAVAGDPAADARPVERREAARILLGYGLSARAIAGRLRVHERTAQRYVQRLRSAA